MPNVSVTLYKSKTYADGTHPICLQTVIKGKAYRKVIARAHESHWNNKEKCVTRKHPTTFQTNEDIDTALFNARQIVRSYEKKGKVVTADVIFSGRSLKELNCIADCATKYETFLDENDKWSAARKYKNLAGKLDEFNNVDILEVDKKYLQDFVKHLEGEGLASNTIHSYVKRLKTILRRENVFNFELLNFKVNKGTTKHTYLTEDELKELAKVEMLAADTFVFAFNVWGARIADVLTMKPDNVVDGVLRYTSRKNTKHFEIELNETALAIIEKYKGHQYLLPHIEQPMNGTKQFVKHIETKTGVINRDLKLAAVHAKIKKNITTHVARHSFAYQCMLERLPLNHIRDLLGHSSTSMTSNYLRGFTGVIELNESVKRVYQKSADK